MTRRWRVRPATRPTRRETGGSRRLTDEVLPPSRPQAYFQFLWRRQSPPTKAALRAALARFDNRPTSGGGFKRRGPKPPPLSLQGDRILKERGKFEIPLSLSGVPAGAAKLPPPGRSKYPYPRCCQRQRRRRYKQSPEPTTMSPTAPIPRDQHRQFCITHSAPRDP